jgi:hypothetical protein
MLLSNLKKRIDDFYKTTVGALCLDVQGAALLLCAF